jgi:hypothetical protein
MKNVTQLEEEGRFSYMERYAKIGRKKNVNYFTQKNVTQLEEEVLYDLYI